MRVIGLISGGKDSTFNLMHCLADGHQLVGLANLYPKPTDNGTPSTDGDNPPVSRETDSYMYQTVGSDGITAFAAALGLPLYRRAIHGAPVATGADYIPEETDEVEDLFRLLKEIRETLDFDAISVGAIMSQYQTDRVENVCSRLGLTSLAYLWKRDQTELLAEMVEFGVEAVIIKVAAMGLDERHLGLGLGELSNAIQRPAKEFGLNVCGEGGEFETFTLDSPIHRRSIVIEEKEVVVHSQDPFAPVLYLRLNKLSLRDKPDQQCNKALLGKLSELINERRSKQS